MVGSTYVSVVVVTLVQSGRALLSANSVMQFFPVLVAVLPS